MCKANKGVVVVVSCGTVYYAVQGVLTFKSVGETLVCDHLNESNWAALSCGAVYYAVWGGSNLKPKCVTIQMKATCIVQYFHVALFTMLYKVVLTYI